LNSFKLSLGAPTVLTTDNSLSTTLQQKKEARETLKAKNMVDLKTQTQLAVQDLTKLKLEDLTPLTPEVISRQVCKYKTWK
jgi:hypothetical protein